MIIGAEIILLFMKCESLSKATLNARGKIIE